MNKLLRNPWVVGALVIGMAALWAVQMRSIFFPGGLAGSEPAPPALVSDVAVMAPPADTATDNVAGSDTLAIEPIDEAPRRPTQLSWDHAPVRDPFGPLALGTPAVSAPPTPAPAPATEPVVETLPVVPTLEAVLSTPSAQIAVIDGHMVRVGDKVSGRPVLKIAPNSVALGRGADASEPLLLHLPAR